MARKPFENFFSRSVAVELDEPVSFGLPSLLVADYFDRHNLAGVAEAAVQIVLVHPVMEVADPHALVLLLPGLMRRWGTQCDRCWHRRCPRDGVERHEVSRRELRRRRRHMVRLHHHGRGPGRRRERHGDPMGRHHGRRRRWGRRPRHQRLLLRLLHVARAIRRRRRLHGGE